MTSSKNDEVHILMPGLTEGHILRSKKGKEEEKRRMGFKKVKEKRG